MSIEQLRRAQLLPTLEHAARKVPYYRARWGDRWKRVRRIEDLHLLPLLTKDQAIAHQHALLAEGERSPYGGTLSSGTLHGDKPPLRVRQSAAEVEALAAYVGARAAIPKRGFVLEVRAMHHGIPEGPPAKGRVRVPWTYTANALRLIRELLATRQADGSRAVAMNIGAGALTALTAWLLERGDEPARFRLQEISTYGYRLSPHWQALVEDVWRAPVLDNFSLSEFRSPAIACGACGYFHWLAPPLLFEVVDAHRGVGALVLTGLFPFVQAMPLIRYFTGDLVELGPFCRAAKDRGFKFRGRIAQCVFAANGALLVSAQDVQDFLDGRPEVARVPHPCNQLGLVSSPDIGGVKFTLDAPKKGHARVRIELRFDPLVFPDAARELAHALDRHLGKPRHLEVELKPPGTLTGTWTKMG